MIRNSATPTFINTGIYDVTISEDKPVLVEILNVTARDTDVGVNGIVRYSINDNQAVANVFGIDWETGMIFARVSLLETPDNIYRVSKIEIVLSTEISFFVNSSFCSELVIVHLPSLIHCQKIFSCYGNIY